MVRMNLTVEDGVPAMLAEMAGGERKRGEYLSRVVRQLYAGHLEITKGDDLESLKLTQAGLAVKVRGLEVRLSVVEGLLNAMIADEGG